MRSAEDAAPNLVWRLASDGSLSGLDEAGGDPTTTVTGPEKSQLNAAAREARESPPSPRTMLSTTRASSRWSQAPRDSAAAA